ncbi:MAG: PTS sugar transporter subunit IIA [Anaerolineales bacterium]|nr:PTS sugar transporter subunit IIA [Anaerolineales bacterium]MCS7249255.1 PTS sugar transporter subunit IIA [Anaerolineales bacterium]MDW8163069.1 PTS sugar transporter subunit IIA [Anaerolineales bacterium]MDW8447018.1 PTS sugar transporter subunit IIA [Anaerolineales bacterium]
MLGLKEEHILLIDSAHDAMEVINLLSQTLEEGGYVKQSFRQAVWEREQSMPTGLELSGEIHAAIPHADVEHVNSPALAVAILKEPIPFKCMVEPEKDIPVRLVFLLAMNEPKKQIEMLQEVATILQDSTLVQKIASVSSRKEVVELLTKDQSPSLGVTTST